MLDLFGIKPNIDLNIMVPDQDLFDISSRALISLRHVLKAELPDIVLVQGDTTSTFIGALGSFYLNIPVGHVEAGLRSGDLRAPFPEEANRIMTSHLATFHFAPTESNRQNLLKENVPAEKIWVTGNTGIDALLEVRDRIMNWDEEKVHTVFGDLSHQMTHFEKIILVTGHRRENFGRGFDSICRALLELARKHPNWLVIYPVHMNPNVHRTVHNLLHGLPNIRLLEPLGYQPFVFLMNKCNIILTDSGGIQEEAPSLGKPVLVLRETTERPEAVNEGTVKIVGTDNYLIVQETEAILQDRERYQRMTRKHNPYGDGRAAERILDIIQNYFSKRPLSEFEG